MTEDEMAGWHHWLDGRESERTPGVDDGQEGLACCDSWGHKELDTTERLNWTECPTLCYPVDCKMLGFAVHNQLLELAQLMSIEFMMPSNHLILCHPLLLNTIFPSIRVFPSESALHIRGQSIGASTSVLPMNIQDWFPLGLTGLISLQSKRLSRVFSSTTVQKQQFFGTQPSLWSNSHTHTWLPENYTFDYMDLRTSV